MYAIVRTGGKQYRVEEGRHVDVDRLPAGEGEMVELKDVLLIAEDGSVTVGSPFIDGARVVAEVEAQARDKKIHVFKYKSKVRTRKMAGHRQHYTRLAVKEILLPGQEAKTLEKPKRRAAKPARAEEAPVAEAAVATPAAEAVAVEAPARRPRRAAPTAEPEPEKKPARRTTTRKTAGAAEKKPAPKAKAGEKKPARRPAARRAKKEE